MSEKSVASFPNVDQMQGGRIYAEAVWNLATEQAAQAEFIEEFHSLIEDVLDPNPELERFFSFGGISQQRREELLEKLFAGRASELVYNFLKTLNRHDRLELLRAIVIHLDELWNEAQNRLAVIARTAVPLDADQLEALRGMISEKFGAEPDLQAEVDPDLLGGLWLRVGDTVYDRSVRSNLRCLRDNILARSTHEVSSR